MSEAAAAEPARAGRATTRTVGRRGVLSGALALVASAAAAGLPRTASAATPTEPGFWIKLKGGWLQTEKVMPLALQQVFEQKLESIPLQFRASGLPEAIWSRFLTPDPNVIASDIEIRANYERGTTPPYRAFILKAAAVESVAVRTERVGDETVLFTDFSLIGRRLTRAES